MPGDTPRVAVLLPLHDQAAFLRRHLISLTDPLLTAWEGVVLDDGSRDDPRPAAAAHVGDP